MESSEQPQTYYEIYYDGINKHHNVFIYNLDIDIYSESSTKPEKVAIFLEEWQSPDEIDCEFMLSIESELILAQRGLSLVEINKVTDASINAIRKK